MQEETIKNVKLFLDNSDIKNFEDWNNTKTIIINKLKDLNYEVNERCLACRMILSGTFIFTIISIILNALFLYKIYSCAITGSYFFLLWSCLAAFFVFAIYFCSGLSKASLSTYYSLMSQVKILEDLIVKVEKSEKFTDELYIEFLDLQVKISVLIALMKNGFSDINVKEK